ncbi:MAG TPA: 16S rRNA (cytidine(1402)-2'-O)-methyltransferase [Dehalococcoidia bacterium]|nr:16S rRNA (cytidine(1402)-2'-O)-methyltransferase [Dehalococcoidia bacterium]
MGTLYLVATPIGNLEDITLRALRVLREAPLVAAEDTRTTRILFRRYGIDTPLTSYNDHNKRAKTPVLLEALRTGDLALVSEAGMPGVSDPGHDLVVAAIAEGHTVTPVPGPSAVTAAVAASGLPSRRFYYLGFLPKATGPRRRALAAVASVPDTLVIFESPHRARATLEDIRSTLGDRRVALCRELTKVHETILRGTVSEVLDALGPDVRGEVTLVVEGTAQPPTEVELDLDATIARLKAQGMTVRDAAAALAGKASRREVYRRWHAEERPSPPESR